MISYSHAPGWLTGGTGGTGLMRACVNVAQVAGSSDRIHMKTTHFSYARHLESIGEVDTAIEHFELSDTARNEVRPHSFTSHLSYLCLSAPVSAFVSAPVIYPY